MSFLLALASCMNPSKEGTVHRDANGECRQHQSEPDSPKGFEAYVPCDTFAAPTAPSTNAAPAAPKLDPRACEGGGPEPEGCQNAAQKAVDRYENGPRPAGARWTDY